MLPRQTRREEMEPIIDHIEITVQDLSVAAAFYDKLLPLLGFDLRHRSAAALEAHDKQVVQYEHPRLGFAITSPRKSLAGDPIHRRRPGALHHMAFRATSRAEVDRLHAEMQRIGATIVSPPREYPEFSPPGYYAFYFKDAEGMKYEIVCPGQSAS
jgi:catechol 2,3-dioxygenase-like lactoylglutathione lyase family enzyme